MIIEPNEEKPLIIETDLGPAQFAFSGWQRRIGLAQSIKDVFSYPIQRRRWLVMRERFQPALHDRIAAHQASERQIVTRIAHSAFILTLPDLPAIRPDAYGEPVPGTFETWSHTLKQQVNRVATEDLLGLDWSPRHSPPRRRSMGSAEFDVWLQIDQLRARTDLREQERALIEAFIAADIVIVKAARALGISSNAAWLRFSRLRKKLLA